MYSDRIVFSQIIDALPMRRFHTCVRRYQGNRKVHRFTCLDQFLVRAFARQTALALAAETLAGGVSAPPHWVGVPAPLLDEIVEEQPDRGQTLLHSGIGQAGTRVKRDHSLASRTGTTPQIIHIARQFRPTRAYRWRWMLRTAAPSTLANMDTWSRFLKSAGFTITTSALQPEPETTDHLRWTDGTSMPGVDRENRGPTVRGHPKS